MDNKNKIEITWSSILKVTAVILAIIFIYNISDILLLIFLSFFLSTVLEPIVDKWESKKIPRGIGVIIIYATLILILGILIKLIIPPISQQLSLLFASFPELWNKFGDNFKDLKELADHYGFNPSISDGIGALPVGIGQAASSFYAFIISFFNNIIDLVFILVLTFYLIVEKDAINKVFRAVVPIKYLPRWTKVYSEIQVKVSDWVRAEVFLSLIIGGMAFIGLIFLVPKYALTLALIAALTEVVPYLGPILSGLPAIFLAFMVPTTSFTRAFAVLVLFVIIHQLENNVIVPQLMKKKVGLSPVITLIAMLIGVRIFGIIGIILAIPVSTAIGIIAREISEHRSAVKN